MLAAAPAPVESLPAHRVALRAAVAAIMGSLATSVVALPLVVLSGDRERDVLMFLAAGGGAAMAAFFVAAVEVARRLRAAGRLAALVVMGALSPAFALCSLIWVYHLGQGKSPEYAWGEIMRWLTEVVFQPNKSLPGAAAVLIPFALVSAAHTGGVPGALGRVLTFPTRVALAAVTGAVACGIAWLAYPPSGSERTLFAGFVLVPPALEVAITLTLPVESRLRTWWAKRREAE